MNAQDFCATSEDSRETLRSPFRCDGYSWATDGKFLIRMKEDLAHTDQGLKNMIKRFGREISTNTIALVLPDTETGYLKCEDCNGSGKRKIRIPCGECHGEGFIVCHECGHEKTCDYCDEEGYNLSDEVEPCVKCRSTGANINKSIRIGNNLLSYGRLSIILKNLSYVEIETKKPSNCDPVMFKGVFGSQEVQGFIMAEREC